MALITSRTSLSQGASNTVSGVVFATGTGADIEINDGASVGTLPTLNANDFFEIRGHSLSNNNGLYQVVTVTDVNDIYQCNKVSGLAPSTASAEQVTFLGDTTTAKSVFFDTAALECYLLEQGNLSVDGVIGQAIYSFMMQEWKADNFLIANAPFPMFAIDSDAGKYIMGQDASGNNNGWNWKDDAGFSIRTRKLLRNMGWNEVNTAGTIIARYVGVVTLGSFEDANNDLAYYFFGNDTATDNSTNFDFAGPVNEAVQFYDLIGDLTGDTPSFASTSTITRATGSFITDGFVVGGQVTIAGSTSNDGTFTLTDVSATTLTLSGTPLTVEAWGTSTIAVDNDNAFTLALRVRDGDPNGKTFGQATLASAGKTVLGNFVYSFPLANATDLKIDETDANIDGNTPYTGMTLTYYASPQARAGLVGGSKNFGIIIDGNNGTAQQVYEWVQRQLRKTTDIDNDASTAIGRMMDGLMRFVGDTLEVGSVDGGLSFPNNPDGGGTGVFIDNLNAASKNSVTFFDNTNASVAFPETIPITCDFNATLETDVASEFDLFYDRTIRTSVADLVISNATSKITSAGTNLPTNSEIAVNKYVRIGGLSGANEDGNGVYQITAINSAGADWSVQRYDGKAIPTTTSAAANVDQNCIDTPDAILVDTDNLVTDTTISFTAPDTISDSNSGLGIFAPGDIIRIAGSTANDGTYEVDTAAAGTVTLIEQTLSTESAGPSITLTEVASGVATTDFSFSYDFDNNTQGGRTVSTNTFVKGKALGATGAQYTESTVQTIQSGTPLTIPYTAQIERNFA